MKLKELKDFINSLPDTFNDYEVENAEYIESNGGDIKYRLDKPVMGICVRENTKEILIMNSPMEEYK